MATTAVRRISMITLAVVLCTTFIAVSLLLNPLAEGVAPAAETVGSWGGYGELPPVW
jgi:4-hydroxybenzoate polyprenyltransferase